MYSGHITYLEPLLNSASTVGCLDFHNIQPCKLAGLDRLPVHAEEILAHLLIYVFLQLWVRQGERDKLSHHVPEVPVARLEDVPGQARVLPPALEHPAHDVKVAACKGDSKGVVNQYFV